MRRVTTIGLIFLLLISITFAAFCWVASFQLSCISNGSYDPVQDDGMTVEQTAAMVARLKIYSVAELPSVALVFFSGFRLYRRFSS